MQPPAAKHRVSFAFFLFNQCLESWVDWRLFKRRIRRQYQVGDLLIGDVFAYRTPAKWFACCLIILFALFLFCEFKRRSFFINNRLFTLLLHLVSNQTHTTPTTTTTLLLAKTCIRLHR